LSSIRSLETPPARCWEKSCGRSSHREP